MDMFDDAMDMSLLPVEVEKVDATERRDRNDELDDDVVYDEAMELRPDKRKHAKGTHSRGRTHTRIHGLREHALNDLWRVSRE